jgi:hypothetical protein
MTNSPLPRLAYLPLAAFTREKKRRGQLGYPILSVGGSTLMFVALEKLKELTVRRKPLCAQFEKNPQRLHLSLEIKIIDDQIADCNRQIRLEKSTRPRITK